MFRIQSYDSIICEFYCIAFVEHMIAGKTLLNCTNSFFPNDFKKNDKIYKSTLRTNMVKENVSLDFILENKDETRNLF